MAYLITIEPLASGGNAFVIPTPSKYNENTATIVDSARNTSGEMIGSTIREDVTKIQLQWKFIEADEWAALLQNFSGKHGGAFFRMITYFDQVSCSLETKKMYISDRNAESFLLYN